MTAVERLQTALNGLGLKAVEARLESLLEQASKKEPSYADFLDELLSCEVDARRTRYLRARLQLAHLPFVKTFDQFDFSFQPSIDERQIRAAHAAVRPRGEQRRFSGATWRGENASERRSGGSRDSSRFRSLLYDGARSGHRSRPGLPRRPAGPEDASVPGAEGSDHR